MNKTVLVICAQDKDLTDVELLYPTLRAGYEQDVDVAISTYGGTELPPSTVLSKYAANNELRFFDVPRHVFVPPGLYKTASTTIAQISISKHFYDLGYERVYLLHADMYLFRDPTPWFEKQVYGKWSFVSLYWQLTACDLKFQDAIQMGSQDILKLHKVTLPDAFVLFNKEFVNYLFERYINEKNMWERCFYKFVMNGDVCPFGMAKEFFEYEARVVGQGGFEKDFMLLDFSTFNARGIKLDRRLLLDIVANNSTICMIHGRRTTALLKSS